MASVWLGPEVPAVVSSVGHWRAGNMDGLFLRQWGPGIALGVVAALVTVAFNVPLNNQLDALDPAGLSAADAATQWRAYFGPWTAWNHVRTVAPLLGSVLLLLGLRHR